MPAVIAALTTFGAALALGRLAPRLGWVEQDPNAMLANVVACLREVLAKLGPGSDAVAGLAQNSRVIGVANEASVQDRLNFSFDLGFVGDFAWCKPISTCAFP